MQNANKNTIQRNRLNRQDMMLIAIKAIIIKHLNVHQLIMMSYFSVN